MKVTKKNGNIVLFDDDKVIRSMLRANADTEEETLSLEAGEYVYGVNLRRAGTEPVTVIREAPFVVQEAVARDE